MVHVSKVTIILERICNIYETINFRQYILLNEFIFLKCN